MTAVRQRIAHLRWRVGNEVRRGPRRVFSEKAGAYRRALRKAEAVTFDVFDTALCRCVPEPSDVFEIVGLRLCARDSCPVDAVTFRRARIDAETRVRAAAAARGVLEVTLREIYDELKTRLPELDERFAYAEEIDVERAVSFANVAVRRLYESALRAGKRIFFVSDTYFPHDVVAELLARAGYAGPHTIFASCESRRTKESGTLFAHVARTCGIDPRRMLHLGDNPRADVEMARRSNVVAYWFGGGLPRTRSARRSRSRNVSSPGSAPRCSTRRSATRRGAWGSRCSARSSSGSRSG